MNRDTMIKWLSENTTREQWSNGPATRLPDNCSWLGVTYGTHVVVRSAVKCVEDITLDDVFCEPVPKGHGSMTDYINNSRECFKLSIRPDQWGYCGLPVGWKWSDDNHDMNTIIEHDWLTEKFNYSDIFGIGEMPPVKRKELFVDGAYGLLTPGPIQAPYTDTAYWDKYHKKYCYIVGSAWDDGALFFAEEFVDGDVTGNYFATERMNLVAGDKRLSILNIIEEELTEKDHGKGTVHCVETMVDRILSEVINHDK